VLLCHKVCDGIVTQGYLLVATTIASEESNGVASLMLTEKVMDLDELLCCGQSITFVSDKLVRKVIVIVKLIPCNVSL